MSESELLGRARKGDKQARNALVEKYMPLLDKAIFTLDLPDGDCEDAKQEGCLGLIEATIRYIPDKGLTFEQYAFAMICNKIGEWQKRERRHREREQAVGMDPARKRVSSRPPGERIADLREAMKALSDPTQREVLEWRYGLKGKHLTFAEIGHRLGLTKQRAKQIHTEAIAEMRSHMGVKVEGGCHDGLADRAGSRKG